MYTTCLFCHGDLGSNEAIEPFPVGTRLAFDAARGRLWVVCRACERWNLTPLEERWEAIEECERRYRDVRTRVSTDNIGLARLRDGLELVRIGQPLRPEMAAWRYGDQFGRRRVRTAMALGGSALLVGAGFAVGPVLAGAVGMGYLVPIFFAQDIVSGVFKRLRGADDEDTEDGTWHVTLGSGERIGVSNADTRLMQLLPDGDSARLLVVVSERERLVGRDRVLDRTRHTRELRGADIARIAGPLLPGVNQLTGSGRQVQDAVRALEEAPSIEALFAQAAREGERRYEGNVVRQLRQRGAFANVPAPLRLAMEMAAHEEQERRAMEGELAELEQAWRDAEEIAGIADGMFVPDEVARSMTRLKGQSGDTRGGSAP
jgi:hypothetical protein